jgi:hypothetical protein
LAAALPPTNTLGEIVMATWKCPERYCTVSALAPPKRPVHAVAANPNFQAKDPHCPVHHVDLIWTPDPEDVADTGGPTGVAHVPNAKFGIMVSTYKAITPIYCDLNQRKHVSGGNWPGDVPTDKPLFKSKLYSRANLGLCILLADSVPWDKLKDVIGGGDVIFDCGASQVGTQGETFILVQGGFQGSIISFHAYPVEHDAKRSGTFKRCKRDNLFLALNVAAIVG